MRKTTILLCVFVLFLAGTECLSSPWAMSSGDIYGSQSSAFPGFLSSDNEVSGFPLLVYSRIVSAGLKNEMFLHGTPISLANGHVFVTAENGEIVCIDIAGKNCNNWNQKNASPCVSSSQSSLALDEDVAKVFQVCLTSKGTFSAVLFNFDGSLNTQHEFTTTNANATLSVVTWDATARLLLFTGFDNKGVFSLFQYAFGTGSTSVFSLTTVALDESAHAPVPPPVSVGGSRYVAYGAGNLTLVDVSNANSPVVATKSYNLANPVHLRAVAGAAQSTLYLAGADLNSAPRLVSVLKFVGNITVPAWRADFPMKRVAAFTAYPPPLQALGLTRHVLAPSAAAPKGQVNLYVSQEFATMYTEQSIIQNPISFLTNFSTVLDDSTGAIVASNYLNGDSLNTFAGAPAAPSTMIDWLSTGAMVQDSNGHAYSASQYQLGAFLNEAFNASRASRYWGYSNVYNSSANSTFVFAPNSTSHIAQVFVGAQNTINYVVFDRTNVNDTVSFSVRLVAVTSTNAIPECKNMSSTCDSCVGQGVRTCGFCQYSPAGCYELISPSLGTPALQPSECLQTVKVKKTSTQVPVYTLQSQIGYATCPIYVRTNFVPVYLIVICIIAPILIIVVISTIALRQKKSPKNDYSALR